MFESIDLTDATLANELGIGCLTVKRAHLWPLSHFVWESDAKHVGVTFFCDCPSPWDDIGLIRFEVFKLPSSKTEYAESIEWYTRSRKKRALKIADDIKFDSSMLHFKALETWEQDSFALSKREVIRVYSHKKFAVIVRFLARSGPLLDHPVFKRAVQNLAFDENKWVQDLPDIVDKRPKKQRLTEYEFDNEQTDEMSSCVDQATRRLKLKKKDNATNWVTAVEKDIDATRKRKNLDEKCRVERAVELGYLVGHAFCEGQSWEWCIVSASQEEYSICICNPNRALAIAPIEWVYRLLAEDVPLNCLLTYNMIDAGRLPPARPDSYTRLN